MQGGKYGIGTSMRKHCIGAGVAIGHFRASMEGRNWCRYGSRALVQVWCRHCRALAWVFKYGLGVGVEVWQ